MGCHSEETINANEIFFSHLTSNYRHFESKFDNFMKERATAGTDENETFASGLIDQWPQILHAQFSLPCLTN